MKMAELLNWLSLGQIATALLTFVLLLTITAPYGRHSRSGWGPAIGGRLTWTLMELPASLGFALLYFQGENALELVPLVLLGFWQLHYVQRTFIYPLLAKGTPKPWPLLVVFFGFSFQLLNAFINARFISEVGQYPQLWLTEPRFLAGAGIFLVGLAINLQSDAILRALRKPGESGYKIPHGGLYRLISCPNYFGEIVEWCGWALMTWSLPGLAFALYTFANLAPRALKHHRWYREKFPDYPAKRKALIPGLW